MLTLVRGEAKPLLVQDPGYIGMVLVIVWSQLKNIEKNAGIV